MPYTSVEKKVIVEQYAQHDKDTGSPEVQIALLTARISNLTRHFKEFKQDNSKRGLMILVGRRKSLLRYLHSKDVDRYKKLISKLGIRGSF